MKGFEVDESFRTFGTELMFKLLLAELGFQCLTLPQPPKAAVASEPENLENPLS